MSTPRFAFEHLRSLLTKSASDADVTSVIGSARVVRSAHTGYVELKAHGISVMFKEAEWILGKGFAGDRKQLHVSALHLHRAGHEGYAAYTGELPGDAVFGDSSDTIVKKLGEPSVRGGGGFSQDLNRPIAYWLRYEGPVDAYQFRLDPAGNVELVTIMVPPIPPVSPGSNRPQPPATAGSVATAVASTSSPTEDLERLSRAKSSFVEAADDVVRSWQSNGVGFEVVDVVLRFMETHKELDFGAPGPLTHFIERFPGSAYSEALVASIQRKPTAHTLWLLNRLLNATTLPAERSALLATLRQARKDAVGDDQAISAADEFLAFQASHA